MGKCRALLIKLGFEKEDATPLQWSRLLTTVAALLASAFNIAFLFPFLPEMVKHFGYSEDQKGYYVGMIASLYFVGRALGSTLWGYLSDKYGRRPFLLLCLLLTAVCTVVFGLSTSVIMAMVVRFITGFVNGSIGLVKTVLYELSDDTNQGAAMSTISLAWGTGIVIGPLVGGYLSLPGEKYPTVFTSSFWSQFPFLVPCLVSSLICILAMVLVFYRLPETNSAISKKKVPESLSPLSAKNPLRFSHQTVVFVDVGGANLVHSGSALTRILSADDIYTDSTQERKRSIIYRPSIGSLVGSVSEPDIRQKTSMALLQKSVPDIAEEDENDAEVEKQKKKSCCARWCDNRFFKLMRSSNVRLLMLLYFLSSFSIIGFEQIFILFASTDRTLGGLDFSTSDLGAAAGFMSLPLIFLQLFIFPRLERRFGAKYTAIGSTAVLMILMALSPMARIFIDEKAGLWVVLFFILAPLRILTTTSFTATSLMVNNSVWPWHAGSINGLAQVFGAAGRALSPLIGGSLFAWSISYDLPYPLDVSLVFTIFSVVLLVSASLTVFVPVTLNKQRKSRADQQTPVHNQPAQSKV